MDSIIQRNSAAYLDP